MQCVCVRENRNWPESMQERGGGGGGGGGGMGGGGGGGLKL